MINLNGLSSGTYVYSILIDGKRFKSDTFFITK